MYARYLGDHRRITQTAIIVVDATFNWLCMETVQLNHMINQ